VKSRHLFSTPATFVASLFAVLLVASVFVVDLVRSRQQYLTTGSHQVTYHGHMLAEHVARSFDSMEILLDELQPQISQLNPWWKWSPQQGHAFLKSRLTRSLPQIRHLLIFSADGEQRFASFSESPPSINVKDRPYFVQLRNGAGKARYGPYVGRNSQRPTYAVAQRLDFPDGRFAGAIMAGIEPDYFEEFCWSTRPFEEFESALVNAEGHIIGLCRPSDQRGTEEGIGNDFRRVLAGGAFATLPHDLKTSFTETDHFILSVETVAGYPDLRVISLMPKTRLLSQWYKYALQSSLLGAIALLALAIAALLIRRQFKEIGRVTEQLSAHRDTLETRVSEATRELEQRRQGAERIAEAKSRFLAAASHDLRQPLQALRLFVGDLVRSLDGTPHKTLLHRIEQATDAMNEQLECLLEISRLDMADIEPQWASLSVSALFTQLAANYRPTAEAKNVRLVFRPRELSVHSDPVLLGRLLGNLIDNAIKFSPQGTVLVCARWSSKGTRIEVRDNGSGIAPEHQQAVYDEFFQIANVARESHAGLGLGLSIVSRVARLLHAPLTLRSRLHAGSVFSIRLSASTPNGKRLTPVEHLIPKLILVGAESESGRKFAAQAGEWGYGIEPADSADAARGLLAASEAIPIIVMRDFCDIGEALRELLHDYPGIVIRPPGGEVLGLGPYDLTEPVRPARLRALLRSLH